MTAPDTAVELDLQAANAELAGCAPSEIVAWAARTFPTGLAMSSSFGIQSAVMLHLVTRVVPDIPIIWIDTGYLFPETYVFAHELRQRLDLNLKVYQADLSPAHMEAMYGKLWESDNPDDLDTYNRIRKVEPMQRAVEELGVTVMFAGLRRDQTDHRSNLPYVLFQNGRHNVYPILDFTSKDVHEYLKEHDLPYHPLLEKGYVTVGDFHSSRPLTDADGHERDTRFRGLKQECGLHLPQTKEEDQSMESAGL